LDQRPGNGLPNDRLVHDRWCSPSPKAHSSARSIRSGPRPRRLRRYGRRVAFDLIDERNCDLPLLACFPWLAARQHSAISGAVSPGLPAMHVTPRRRNRARQFWIGTGDKSSCGDSRVPGDWSTALRRLRPRPALRLPHPGWPRLDYYFLRWPTLATDRPRPVAGVAYKSCP
jgi:hypothetical protein